MENIVKGYKVFNPDWTCRDKQYTCPGIFEDPGDISVCSKGMHFCKKAADCFNYYDFDPNNHVAEVIAHGKVLEGDDKCCTDKLEIVREIPWAELLEIVNTGYGNSGYGNSGYGNSGNRNSGSWNSGSWNSGAWNSGSWNSGNGNSGNGNSGSESSGNGNSGNGNSGSWNSCNFSNGCFNTADPKIYLFDKPSEWTYRDWLDSEPRALLNQINCRILVWIYFEDMSDEEKTTHPEARTTGGYLKKLDNSECAIIWWRGLSEEDKAVIKAIPNFDPAIFKQITGIDVEVEP